MVYLNLEPLIEEVSELIYDDDNWTKDDVAKAIVETILDKGRQMSRLDVPTLQCDRCKETTTDPRVMTEFTKLKSDKGTSGENWDLCMKCWIWYKERFLTMIGSLPGNKLDSPQEVKDGQAGITAKVRVNGMGPLVNGQAGINLVADYLDGRNKEWAQFTPHLSIAMTIKEGLEKKFGVGQAFKLVFIPEEG